MKIPGLFFIYIIFCINGSGQTLASRIDSLMSSFYQPSLPGAVIAVTQYQKTIFKKSYGVADLISGKPLTLNDNFNIGSLTKQFTSFALLELYNQGKLSLYDTLGKFFKLKPALASIPISRLMDHSSGIPDHYGFTDTNRVKHATDADVLEAVQLADSLYFISGTRYRYSNTAYCLLGLLIEKLSGISYPDFLEKWIFKPLDIQDARIFQMSQTVKRRVTGYDLVEKGKFKKADAGESVFFSTEADGGLYISMNNYLKWCRAVESGWFSITPMIKMAWQKHTIIDTLEKLWYGYGWFIRQKEGTPKVVYHTGSNGGFRSVVFMIPSQDYCITIFSNRSDIDLEALVSRIHNLLSIPDNSFIKSAPLESFIHSWPIFAPCKETSSYSTSFRMNLNVKGMVSN